MSHPHTCMLTAPVPPWPPPARHGHSLFPGPLAPTPGPGPRPGRLTRPQPGRPLRPCQADSCTHAKPAVPLPRPAPQVYSGHPLPERSACPVKEGLSQTRPSCQAAWESPEEEWAGDAGGPSGPSSHTRRLGAPSRPAPPPYPVLLFLAGMASPAVPQGGARALGLQERQARGRYCRWWVGS